MAQNDRLRQQKLLQKRKDRGERKKDLNRLVSCSNELRMSAAATWPIVESGLSNEDRGIRWATLVRRSPEGMIAIGNFLVDSYCLGVKDAIGTVVTGAKYSVQTEMMRRHMNVKEVAPEALKKFVVGAVKYAEQLGLKPHPEFENAFRIFGSIDETLCSDEFNYGLNGKPHYIQGITETSTLAAQACRAVTAAGGGYVLIPGKMSDKVRKLIGLTE